MPIIINTVLGESKGKPRVWIEGKKLEIGGFQPGNRYDVKIRDTNVVLKISENGRYSVSQRKRNNNIKPLIDVRQDILSQMFAGITMVRVLIHKSHIIITSHHKERRVRERLEKLVNDLKSNRLSMASLYHGFGGLDAALHNGLKQKGVRSKLAVAVECEPVYLDASLSNNTEIWDAESVAIESKLEDINLSNKAMSVSLLAAGIPCTGASRSGRSKLKLDHAESHESAGAQFYYTLKFIESVNPCLIILENVVDYMSTASMEVIRSTLSHLDYVVHEFVLNGNEFGALESRNRMCVIAVTRGLEDYIDLDSLKPVREKEQTISQILEAVPLDSDMYKPYTYLAEKEEKDIKAGKGFRRQLLSGREETLGVSGKGYGKARSTEPFIKHPENENLSRLMTASEHAKVKTIPEHLINGLSATRAHECLGQSVIFSAFQSVGQLVGDTVNKYVGSVARLDANEAA